MMPEKNTTAEPESLGEHIKETEGYSKYNEKP